MACSALCACSSWEECSWSSLCSHSLSCCSSLCSVSWESCLWPCCLLVSVESSCLCSASTCLLSRLWTSASSCVCVRGEGVCVCVCVVMHIDYCIHVEIIFLTHCMGTGQQMTPTHNTQYVYSQIVPFDVSSQHHPAASAQSSTARRRYIHPIKILLHPPPSIHSHSMVQAPSKPPCPSLRSAAAAWSGRRPPSGSSVWSAAPPSPRAPGPAQPPAHPPCT